MCKTPLFTKEKKYHYNLNLLYYRNFYVNPNRAPSLNPICQMRAPFQKKERRSFEEGTHWIFHIKRGVLIRGRRCFRHRYSFELMRYLLPSKLKPIWNFSKHFDTVTTLYEKFSNMNNKICNSNNCSYQEVNYFFLKNDLGK